MRIFLLFLLGLVFIGGKATPELSFALIVGGPSSYSYNIANMLKALNFEETIVSKSDKEDFATPWAMMSKPEAALQRIQDLDFSAVEQKFASPAATLHVSA